MHPFAALTWTVKKERRRKPSLRLSAIAAACTDADLGKPARVNGPYPERGKWRIYLIDGSGRKAFLFATRAEAEAMKATLTARAKALSERTIGDTLDAYRDYRVRVRGVLQKTADDHCRHLRAILPVEDALSTLTAERAGRLYLDYTERANRYTGKPIAVATHQWVLLIAKCWGRWLVKAGIAAQSPFSAVEPIGRRSAGKAQLTRDEAQRLSRVAVQKAQAGDDAAVGALLFSADGRKPRPHQYWWRKVHELCNAANVLRVCPRSLRGLHTTLAIEEGASGEAVARALGHTRFEITAKHYATPDSVANARLEKASQSLAYNDVAAPAGRLEQLLSNLTSEERTALR